MVSRPHALVVMGFVLLSSVACSGSSVPEARPTACASPVGVSTESLPNSLNLGSFGVVTKVEERAGFAGAEVITEESVIELYPRIVRELGERGYTFVGGDNEGFEAEMAFLDRSERNVSFSIRQGCGEQILVRVLVQGAKSG